jgi:hypothetical protein
MVFSKLLAQHYTQCYKINLSTLPENQYFTFFVWPIIETVIHMGIVERNFFVILCFHFNTNQNFLAMNRFVQLFTKLHVVIVVIALSSNYLNAQELIYYWNFNDNAPAANTNWDQPIPATIGNAEITYTFTEAYSFAGTTINGIDGEVNGGSFAPRGGNEMINNGAHFTMSAPTTGYQDIILSYPTRRTSTGFNTQEVQYTVNGTTWLTKEIIDISGFDNNWVAGQLVTINFSGVSGVDNNPSFAIRIILTGATSAAGNNRFDNIRINGAQPGAVSPPVNLLATAAGPTQIDLSWQPNNDDDTVLLAWSEDGVFGNPAGTYNSGDPITGGGIVLQFNTNTEFSHEDLDPGTTYYYKAWSYDGNEYSIGITANATTIPLPATTALPYNEAFDDDLGECYVYSVSGPTKLWNHNTYEDNGYAQINGFNSGDLELDWLILPGINFNDYENEQMTFETWWRYGEDDDDNYLKLFYSADYPGTGDPTAYTWTELSFTQPDQEQTWAGSGNINLSGINGNMVYIGFKYRYESGKYKWWQVDNISITGDPVGIANHPDNITIGIWPNPATGFVNIEAPVSMTHIIIMNINGAIVKEIPVNAMKTIADVSDLARGYYVVEIQPTNEMAPIHKKLIIH